MDTPFAERIVRGACPHDCPDTCALETTVVNGRAISVRGAKDHPTTRGALCTKVAHYLDRTYHASRLLTPLQRVSGKREAPRFVPMSWDAALSKIATQLRRVIDQHGGEAILPYSYAGNMGLLSFGSLDRRFFHALGASQLDRTICSSAGGAGMTYTLGTRAGPAMEAFVEAELIILWGTNPITSNLHLWSFIQEAKRRGAYVIAIDPLRSQSAEKCHEHWPIKPGTDGALALGLMHCLIRDNYLDHDYITRHTLGFADLAERVKAYDPHVVAAITGIAAADIERLATRYGATRKSAIRINYGLQRHAGGGMAVRTICCLPALTGAWREACGGVLLSTSGLYPANSRALERPDLMPGWPEKPPRTINMSALGDALTRTSPGIHALFVYNSNPAAVAPDSNAVLAGLKREDLFTVVHDSFLTDTADYADIVLPATTHIEQFDIHKSYGHRTILLNQPAIAPLGEAKSNTDLFRALAKAMGLTDPCHYETDESMARSAFDWSHTALAGQRYEDLESRGWIALNVPAAVFADGGFPTPSGKCEFYSQTLADAGHDPLPTYTPHHEDAERSLLAKRYPLSLNTPPERNFLNTTFANIERFTEPLGEPTVLLHPQDAQVRSLTSGDWVDLFNDRGRVRMRVKVTPDTRVGVATARSIWWAKKSPDGQSINALTSQALTDFAGGATFYDCLVDVQRAHEG
jgi:anaerobic selenocysteine-containing dehydrogenase